MMNFSSLIPVALVFCAPPAGSAADYAPRRTTPSGFPIYTNRAAGPQLNGQHAPATTPALSPEAAQKRFSLPDGFEIRLFASEPEVVNPVAMTWDERGRLWVLELYEFPLGAKPGDKPRDRIKILEDTDGDGKADKVTVFADGLNLATGLLLGYGGVFVGQAPDFLFLEDTNGDDVADKRTVLKTGFGLHDRHELLNGFTWGPDGWLYLTHGVFTHSTVKDPNDPGGPAVTVDAAVARYHPLTKKFEVFADGTSNPWGVDFDRAGNAFVSACVIDHLFHMAPGGLYARQGGSPANSHAYELLPSIVDHKHKMAAYSGVDIYQGSQFPAEYRGTILIGNIHDNSIHQDRLTPNGSSFKASFIKDFVRANDGWFMPVSTQTGPDGAVWIMDWYDKYPCYQNANADPEGVDRELGRIWRVVYTGSEKGKPVPSRPDPNMNLARLNSAELVKLLEHPNVWQRRMAQRLLSERRDASTQPALQKLLAGGPSLDGRLAALWTLHGSEQLTEGALEQLASDKESALRAWAARLTGERRLSSETCLARLKTLASDSDPSVRLAAATAARQYVSSSLTVNTPVSTELSHAATGDILEALIKASAHSPDPALPFLIWMAAEPGITRDPRPALGWFTENGAATLPLSGQLLKKTMRRICDQTNQAARAEQINAAARFLGDVADKTELALAALDGLIEGAKTKGAPPTIDFGSLLEKLAAVPALAEKASRLAALWGDTRATETLISKMNEPEATAEHKLKAIRAAREAGTGRARESLLRLLAGEKNDGLAIEAIRALGEIGGDTVADDTLKRWQDLSPGARRAAAEVLVSRKNWTRTFLAAVENKQVSPTDISATTIRSLAQNSDASIRERAAKAIGRFRASDTDKLKLIAGKRKVVLNGQPDINAGYEVARRVCFVCHKLHGEGAEVGPDLTGVGRSSLDALLANVIDPNQIIGKGYENVEVETKDGRLVSGRLVEETETRVKLLSAGPKEEVVARSDIAKLRVSEMSVMPEGLEQMPDADFRNLIWYILNPPQDNRPMTPALRRELIGEGESAGNPSAAVGAPLDAGRKVVLRSEN